MKNNHDYKTKKGNIQEVIPVFKPLIEKEELDACARVFKIGWLGMGSFVNEFEEKVKKFVNAKDRYVVAVNTGYSALHLALISAGVKAGDEVITPSFNNIADFQAILAVGAEPVFCDIDIDTLCIDLEKAQKLISKKTKAIIVMDYDCVLCDHDSIKKFASKNRIRVIHDAAHAFGSKYKGKMIGSFSDICVFSFDPVKTITSTDGGIIIVKKKKEYEMLHELRLIGMKQSASLMYKNQRAWTYDVEHQGFRYHMGNLHAAIGLAQLAKIMKISDTRRNTCRFYNEYLSKIKGIVVPKTDFKDISPFLYYIRVLDEKRETLREYLKERGIDTGIHWQPGHWLTLFKNCRKGDLSITDRIGKEILSLPLHSKMKMIDQKRVVDIILSFYKKK